MVTITCDLPDDTLNYSVSDMNFQVQPEGRFESGA